MGTHSCKDCGRHPAKKNSLNMEHSLKAICLIYGIPFAGFLAGVCIVTVKYRQSPQYQIYAVLAGFAIMIMCYLIAGRLLKKGK